MDRRDFLKIVGISTVAGTASLYGCKPKTEAGAASGEMGPIPTDKMTYRSFPSLGDDKISILGYGCMRWPTIPNPKGEGEMIDQEAVNELVDYAIAHGVNYFDTAPVYCKGASEKATGIALSRHPRNSYFIATKLSNMRGDNSIEFGKEMFANSLRELQTDYLDYLLLHNLGNKDAYNKRFIENGLLDYLLQQKREGKIRNLGWSFHGEKAFFDFMLDEAGVHWDFIQIQMNYVDWQRGNPTAEYMYKRLAEKNIPVVIMEPLLGGRLAKMNYQAMEMLKDTDTEE